MDVTVLISTWDNAKRLKITLDTFKKLIIPNGLTWQLIIVNNNCTDNTDEIVSNYKSALPILYLKEPVQGLSRARNTGLNMAKGQLIIFTDDDVEPCKEWLDIYWKAFLENQKGYFWGGPIDSDYESGKPDMDLLSVAPSSVRGLVWGTPKRILSESEYFISANWAAPLVMVLKAGGFDIEKGLGSSSNVSIGEETDLMRKLCELNLSRMYLPNAKIQHYVPKEKCTLEHVLARSEASAYDGYSKYKYRLRSWIIFKKPIGLYIHIMVYYLIYILKRIFKRKFYSSYIKYRVAIIVTREYKNNLALK